MAAHSHGGSLPPRKSSATQNEFEVLPAYPHPVLFPWESGGRRQQQSPPKDSHHEVLNRGRGLDSNGVQCARANLGVLRRRFMARRTCTCRRRGRLRRVFLLPCRDCHAWRIAGPPTNGALSRRIPPQVGQPCRLERRRYRKLRNSCRNRGEVLQESESRPRNRESAIPIGSPPRALLGFGRCSAGRRCCRRTRAACPPTIHYQRNDHATGSHGSRRSPEVRGRA